MSVRVPAVRAQWALSLYRDAGEAGGCFVSTQRRAFTGVRGQAADPDRARAEAARRARAAVRRYCAANRLNRLGTLTYRGDGCHDARQLRCDVGSFFRSLRTSLGASAFPYVWVPEWHKTGHGLHVHFAVGRFVKRSLIERAWGRGFVHIKALTDLPVGSSSRDEARRAAGYLSKYVTKSFDVHVPGFHRYEVAQGFRPIPQRLTGVSAEDVLRQSCVVMGAPPVQRWSSLEVEDWQGPPAVWFAWA